MQLPGYPVSHIIRYETIFPLGRSLCLIKSFQESSDYDKTLSRYPAEVVGVGDRFKVRARCVSVAGESISRRRISMRRESARSLILSKEEMGSTCFMND